MKGINFVWFTLLFPISICCAQISLSGIITDANGAPVSNVNITINPVSNTNIIAYTYSKSKGDYSIEFEVNEDFVIAYSAFGFETLEDTIAYSPNKIIKQNVSLRQELVSLNEVVIKTKRPIRVKEDTITIRAKNFADGSEDTVEDLLKKIPGLQVDSNGTIKVGNREIEKLMIDGDDFFERGYKILSKNMPAYPIEEIEILNHYSNNRLLKGVEESDKVALNLKLDEKSKRIWFGNLKTSLGNNGFYELKGNLMNFGKKNKYYFLTNLNTIGNDATGDIERLTRSFRINEPASIGDNQRASSILSLSSNRPNFEQSRTNFNNAELLSLNAIFNPSEKVKIKTLAFFNGDEKSFLRNSINNVDVSGSDFTNTEIYTLRNNKKLGFGQMELIYNPSKRSMLETKTKFNFGDFDDRSSLIFNGNSTLETLESRNNFFDQKISFTKRFDDKKVLLITGRFIDEISPQNYTINQFFYEELFPESDEVESVTQLSDTQMQYMGFNAHFLDRKASGNLIELQIGNEYRKDKLESVFSLISEQNELTNPSGYQNQIKYQVNDLYVKAKYRYKLNNFDLFAEMNVHQLFNHLNNNESSSEQSILFVNPSIGFDWKINDNNKLNTSYSLNRNNAGLTDVYSDFILNGFRSFIKGTGTFNQLDESRLLINYQLGNWTKRFFANTVIIYNKNHDFFSTNSLISQNYTQSEKILIQDRDFISLNSKIDYYFKFISSNLKSKIGYSQSEFKNIVNDSNLRKVTSRNLTYGFELRSGFRGFFNYHLGTEWNSNSIKTTIKNSFTDNVSFLDLVFQFSKKLNVQLQSERYYFGNLNNNNSYYFLDFDLRYDWIQNKLAIGLMGRNLFNTNTFRNFNISDIGTSIIEYRLLPRFLQLKLDYRF